MSVQDDFRALKNRVGSIDRLKRYISEWLLSVTVCISEDGRIWIATAQSTGWLSDERVAEFVEWYKANYPGQGAD